MGNLHDLRIGDLVVREMDDRGRTEHHIGEVIAIRARIRYVDVGYQWGEWWDVSSATKWPLRAEDAEPYRLQKATIDQLDRLGLR